MAAAVRALPRRGIRRERALEVVAVVLADGSVKPLGGRREAPTDARMATGTIAGPDWLLWWQRRRFAPEG